MGEKTPAQLGATSTPVLGTDLLVLYRGAGGGGQNAAGAAGGDARVLIEMTA
jgi:hypothetical protein